MLVAYAIPTAPKLLLIQPEINHHHHKYRALHLSYTVAPSRHTEKSSFHTVYGSKIATAIFHPDAAP